MTDLHRRKKVKYIFGFSEHGEVEIKTTLMKEEKVERLQNGKKRSRSRLFRRSRRKDIGKPLSDSRVVEVPHGSDTIKSEDAEHPVVHNECADDITMYGTYLEGETVIHQDSRMIPFAKGEDEEALADEHELKTVDLVDDEEYEMDLHAMGPLSFIDLKKI